MPELPEVEAARKFVCESCLGSEIVRVETKEQGGGPREGQFDDLIVESDAGDAVGATSSAHPGEAALQSALLHKVLSAVQRRGKHIWFDFADRSASVLFHFGMTGSFVIRDRPIPLYRSSKPCGTAWPPKFTKLEMIFSNGTQLAYCDPRRIGRIKIRSDPLRCSPLKELALDPVLDPLPSAAALAEQIAAYSVPIKALLLDQEKVFCGIGNYLADEILFQSCLHPETPANRITVEGLGKLLAAMQSILSIAIEANADSELFPKDWLFHYRWDKAKAKKAALTMPDGKSICFETHGGRTSAIVPAVQLKNGIYVSSSGNTTTTAGGYNAKGKTSRKRAAAADADEAEANNTECDTKMANAASAVEGPAPAVAVAKRIARAVKKLAK